MTRANGPAVCALLAAVLVVLCGATVARAMPPEQKLQKLVEHRREIVRKSLQLDPQQQAAFDPVYASYEEEREVLARERNGFVDDFALAALQTSPEQATALIDRSFRLRKQRIEVDEKYRPRFAAVLPPQKVLLLYQLNFILDAVVNYDLAGMIPMVE